MDQLERYLDQVCRGIGGPRSLRQHIRQELREHLLDAAAEFPDDASKKIDHSGNVDTLRNRQRFPLYFPVELRKEKIEVSMKSGPAAALRLGLT